MAFLNRYRNNDFRVGETPPIVNKLVAGDLLFNTEHKKDNQVSKMKNVKVLGSQKVMLDLLNSKAFDPSQIPQSNKELMDLCSRLEINASGWHYNYSFKLPGSRGGPRELIFR